MKKINSIFLIVMTLFLILNLSINYVASLETKFNNERNNYIDELVEYKNRSLALSLELQYKHKEINFLQDSIEHMLTFNADNVKRYLDYFDVAHKDIVYHQSILETGNFSSELFLSNNNLFGMKNPYQRATTSLGSFKEHALYDNYLESIKDYKIYQDYYYNGRSYYQFLIDKGYAEDLRYVNKIKTIKYRNEIRGE